MNNIRNAIILAFGAILFAAPAFAVDLSSKASDTQKIDADMALSWKKNMEQRESKGKRNSATKSKGWDKTTSESLRDIANASRNTSADVSMPLDAVFAGKLAELEKSGVEPFATCRLITGPRTAAEFGLTAEMPEYPGVVNTTRAEWLSKIASSNGNVEQATDPEDIRGYGTCMAYYGGIIADAYLSLSGDIKALKASVGKDKSGNVSVRGIGLDDFVKLANVALDETIANGIRSKVILDTFNRIVKDPGTCVFNGEPTTIKCGGNKISLTTPPQLFAQGIPVYGSAFMGFSGAFRVSTSYSLSAALEKMKSNSNFVRFVEDASRYAEKLEGQGKTREAAYARKKAVDMALASDASLSTSSLPKGN